MERRLVRPGAGLFRFTGNWQWCQVLQPDTEMILCFEKSGKPGNFTNMGLRNRTDFLHENCFFVTTTCRKFLHVFNRDSYFEILIECLQFVAKKYEAVYLAYVLMPNHLHFIIYFKNKNRLSNLMRDFKRFTSGEIRRLVECDGRTKLLEELRFTHRNQKFKLWEDRFDDVHLYTLKVLETKLNYIHSNPMQEHWNLVHQPELYAYSSAAFYETGQQKGLEIFHYKDFF